METGRFLRISEFCISDSWRITRGYQNDSFQETFGFSRKLCWFGLDLQAKLPPYIFPGPYHITRRQTREISAERYRFLGCKTSILPGITCFLLWPRVKRTAICLNLLHTETQVTTCNLGTRTDVNLCLGWTTSTCWQEATSCREAEVGQVQVAFAFFFRFFTVELLWPQVIELQEGKLYSIYFNIFSNWRHFTNMKIIWHARSLELRKWLSSPGFLKGSLPRFPGSTKSQRRQRCQIYRPIIHSWRICPNRYGQSDHNHLTSICCAFDVFFSFSFLRNLHEDGEECKRNVVNREMWHMTKLICGAVELHSSHLRNWRPENVQQKKLQVSCCRKVI